MATITGLTAERMLEIEAASVVDGDVSGNDLILTRKDGSLINAGNVRGPVGPAGPMGSALSVVTAQQILDVGLPNQIRAGRQLTPSDFTNMGLSVPLGLWNLSNANDSSGNGRHLTIKGAVPFGVGINGLASTAAVLSGALTQTLHISDTGAADPFRIRTGSYGCWFRTAVGSANQILICKYGGTNQAAWGLLVTTAGNVQGFYSTTGADQVATVGLLNVIDDRWHFAVVTHDANQMRVYVDGQLDQVLYIQSVIFPGSSPLNIGSQGADVATNAVAGTSHYGRIDEAFVTADVLTPDQVRNLYCASVPHALGVAPSIQSLSVRRTRRGSPLAPSDFPAQPSRLYNFTGGAFTDQGSNNTPVALTNTPQQILVAGADGTPNGGYFMPSLSHNGLAATDAGLPAALTPRSFGCWFKAFGAQTAPFISWGNGASSASGVWFGLSVGNFGSQSVADPFIAGPYAGDGLWHFGVCVEDNASPDPAKRKLYLDGKMVGASSGMGSIVLGGANRFRIGAGADGNNQLIGEVDAAFVYPGVLTFDQIIKLYNIGLQALAMSPKAAGDHIEAIETARLLATFDSLETNDVINLAVMA